MTTKDQNYMRIAKDIMITSTMQVKVGAIIVSSGRILSVGRNRKGTTKVGSPEARTVHAEIDALAKLLSSRGDIPKRSRIYVYREANGIEAIALPCKDCLATLFKHGITKICFTINGGYAWLSSSVVTPNT